MMFELLQNHDFLISFYLLLHDVYYHLNGRHEVKEVIQILLIQKIQRDVNDFNLIFLVLIIILPWNVDDVMKIDEGQRNHVVLISLDLLQQHVYFHVNDHHVVIKVIQILLSLKILRDVNDFNFIFLVLIIILP